MIDNVPVNYTAENFRDEVLDLLVNQKEDVYQQLKEQLQKTSRSYKDLVLDLSKGKEMRSGIDFYFGAARIFLRKPFLLVKARKNTQPEEGTTGPAYVAEKHFLVESDKFLNPKDIKLKFAFNGIDFYCPFLPSVIGNLYREVMPVMRDIEMAYEDVCSIAQRLPSQKSINSGMHSMKLHLQAATEIAKTVRVTCGYSDPNITEQPGPTFDPMAVGTVTRKHKKCDVFDLAGIPYKQQKKGQLPTVSLDAHLEVMDAAGEPTLEPRENVGQQSTQHPTPVPGQMPQGSETSQEHVAPLATGQDAAQDEPLVVDKQADQLAAGEGAEAEDDDEYVLIKQAGTDPHPTQCVCGEEFNNREQLKNHKTIHWNNNYTCAGKIVFEDGSSVPCEKEFDTSGGMWRHYRTIHLGVWLYYCPVPNCKHKHHNWGPYAADSEGAVKKHMASDHGCQSDLACTKSGCKYVAPSKARLRDHIKRHSSKTLKLYHCNICGKGYREKTLVAIHKRQEHPEKEGDTSGFYFCEKCEKKFATISGRNAHVKNQHLKKKEDKKKKKNKKEKKQSKE